MIFFFNATATTEIYPLSLHDALRISHPVAGPDMAAAAPLQQQWDDILRHVDSIHEGEWMESTCRRMSSHCCWRDRKSTRLNSSHQIISYPVFCLKKKIHKNYTRRQVA